MPYLRNKPALPASPRLAGVPKGWQLLGSSHVCLIHVFCAFPPSMYFMIFILFCSTFPFFLKSLEFKKPVLKEDLSYEAQSEMGTNCTEAERSEACV